MKTGTETRTAHIEDSAVAKPVITTYRVVQLAERGIGVLNEKSQVAFTEFTADARTAKFYDGHTIRNLGTLGGANAEVAGLNDKEEIAGSSNVADSPFLHAFRWSKTTGMVDLGTLPGTVESLASDINNSGDVIGTANDGVSESPARAVLWRRRARPLDLGLDRGVFSFLKINDAGQVMGTTPDRNGIPQAFSWTQAGGVVRLRGRNIANSDARALNASGQITGVYTRADNGEFTGYLWTPGRSFIELQGNRPAPFNLNDRGMVVGVIFLTQTAFVWTRERGTENLGVLPGGSFSNAYGVNNRGQVVGDQPAFLWTREEGMVDLNARLRNAPPGFALTIARQINEQGAILAGAIDGSLVVLLPGNGTNEAPVVGSINGPIIARFGEPQSFSAAFTDVDVRDTHTAIWSWGDGTEEAGTVTERRGAGTVTGTHTFDGPETVRSVRLTVTDSSGKRTTVRHDVIVAPPTASVAGAGTFMSPPHASKADPGLFGPAAFTFFVGYDQEARAPQGAMLQFSLAHLDFRSERFDSQAVEGAKVQYRGSGSLNGKGDYRFALTVVPRQEAGGDDRIALKIWHLAPGTSAEVMDYDSQGDGKTAGAGSEAAIVLHGGIVVERHGQ